MKKKRNGLYEAFYPHLWIDGFQETYFKLCGLLMVFLLILTAHSISAQTTAGKVSGKVSDETGAGIPGVTVVVKGTTIGTITDNEGAYQIAGINQKDVLLFSFVGKKPVEILASTPVVNVVMEDEAIGLEEVVAIGYGTMKKRDITGSVASVTSEQITAAPVADVTQALKGKLAGVSVVSQDGRPGADVSIRVRGGGSITQSNDPLFIVDGFPVSSISNIPANQIQSIDVLKDASSTAIYGARGANGVIIITTKSGSVGKTTVSYDGYFQYNNLPHYLDVMNGYDYIAFNWAYASAIGNQYAEAWEKLWLIGRYQGANTEGINHYKNVASRDYTAELYNSSLTHNHNFNISSGTEKSKYILSLNHIDQEGTKVGSWYKRTNVQFKLDQALSKKINLTFNTRFVNIENGDNEGNSTAYWFRPIDSKDILGDMDTKSNTQLGMFDDLLQDTYSPVSLIEDTEISDNKRSLYTNTVVSWEIIKGLTAKSDLGLSTNWDTRKSWSGAIKNKYIDINGNILYSGNAAIRSAEGWNLRWVNTLNYEVQGLGPDHSLTMMAGMEVADSHYEFREQKGNEYPASYDANRAWYNMNDFLRRTEKENFEIKSGAEIPNRLISYFGRANYILKNKYLFTGTFRADGSSRFAPTNRWGYFPAGAVAWRMSEESFLQDAYWLNNLKLRVSYGSVGSDGISADLWKQSWTSSTSTFSIKEIRQLMYNPWESTSTALTNTGNLAIIANPNLKWETTITRNIGLDFSIFDNRLSGSVEVYKNTVKDLLLITPVSDLTGFKFAQENVGSTSNRGLELSLNGDIVQSKDFNLSGSFNINFNKNRVEELAEGINGQYSSGWGGVRLSPSNDYYLTVGQPVGLIRGYVHEGWYTTSDFDYDAAKQIYTLKAGVPDVASGILPNIFGTFSNKPGSQSAYPGVQKLKDISGKDGVPDGVINDLDLGVIGNTNPKHTGGFGLNGNYKNIDFGLDFNWSYGNDIYNATHVEAYLGNKEAGLFRNRFQELAGHYKIYDIVNGQLTKVVEPAALDALNANATTYLPYPESAAMSTFGIEDGSYLRLNTVTLGYSLPKKALNKLGINRFRIYGSIYNALTFTKYTGFDPEVNVGEDRNSKNNGGYPTPGLDYGAYPRARSFTLGVNIEF